MTLLLRTVHGSTLYGLNHTNSDEDYYEVYSGKGRARQTIDEIDLLSISYDSFMHQCYKGVPQALEALFSPCKEIDKLSHIKDSINIQNNTVYKTYVRTIRNFWRHDIFKIRRHAVRLSLNLADIIETGRFSPYLSDADKSLVNWLAETGDLEECPAFNVLGISRYEW